MAQVLGVISIWDPSHGETLPFGIRHLVSPPTVILVAPYSFIIIVNAPGANASYQQYQGLLGVGP